MKRLLIPLFCLPAMAAAQTAPGTMTLTWLGQSTFVMSTSTGLKALLDPTNPGAFKPAPVDGLDLVTITHEHPDHNYVNLATGNPEIIHGLASGEVAKIDKTVKGVRLRTVTSFHDAQKGAQRGKNAIFVFEMP
jgi:L-ascorbate metabolism protein UlaG (beta-lactamase superfamily)